MSGIKRKAVIKNLVVEKKASLESVHTKLANKHHRHVCTNQQCRLVYEDSCAAPSANGRCHTCLGLRRPWVYEDGLTGMDPRACCVDNTSQMTETKDLLRYQCAGPGPWYQCRTCFRTHGHPCVDQTLLDRPLAVSNQKGTHHV